MGRPSPSSLGHLPGALAAVYIGAAHLRRAHPCPAARPLVRLHCLGSLSVERDGTPVGGAVAQPRRAALLALVASAGSRGITRDAIIASLWPDQGEDRAPRVLSQALYALRRELGSEDSIRGSRELRLDTELVSCDLWDFRRCLEEGSPARAAELYAGAFLDGFRLPGAREFERWVEEERSRLAHQYEGALEQAACAAEDRGDALEAAEWWRTLAGHDPLNARVALRLMRGLVAAGDRNGAIRHASIYAALVEQELGLPGDLEVLAFADELREQAMSRAGDPTRPVEPGSGPGVDPSPSLTEPDEAPAEASVRAVPAPEPARDGARARPALRPARERSRLRSTAWLAGAALILAAVALVRVLTNPGASSFDRDLVVVVPLQNRTGDEDLDAVGIMAAEWITQALSRTGIVQLVDAQTMLATSREAMSAGEDETLRTVALRTGAGTIVSGSYYLESDRLSFLATISDAGTGRILTSVDAVDVERAQPTEALEPLRQRVTGALAVLMDDRLNNFTVAASRPPTYRAYQEFLVGMTEFGADYRGAIGHFARASELDPSYWQARLWSGQAYANLRDYRAADSVFAILLADDARLAPYDRANLDYFHRGFVAGDWQGSYEGARRMVELAPRAAHALYALGVTSTAVNRTREAMEALERIDLQHGWGRDWAQRILNLEARALHQQRDHVRELAVARRLKALAPSDGWTHLPETKALVALGRLDEAQRRIDEAVAIPASTSTWEPFSPGSFLTEIGLELKAHGHEEAGGRALVRALDWYESRSTEAARSTPGKLELANALLLAGNLDQARSLFGEIDAESPDNPVVIGALATLNLRRGRRAEADALAGRLRLDRRPYQFGRPAMALARLSAEEGELESAVRWLVEARRTGLARIYTIHQQPEFRALESYAPYRELLEPIASRAPSG